MKEAIRTYAYSLGFDAVGFASQEDLKFRHDSFLKIKNQNTFGDMGYLYAFNERQKRVLQEIPTCRSVVVVGLNSFQVSTSTQDKPFDKTQDRQSSGRVARYAWGRDYHGVIKEKLERLSDYLKGQFSDIQTKICVDTEAVLEKPLAVRAGLGFQGKNTLLIHPRYGTWLLLGELFTSLSLESDGSRTLRPGSGQAIRDEGCGSCRLCVEACPTDALKGDYTMDASRCLSYYTIESKREIPAEIQEKMGDRVFGCDICMEVCPHNRKVLPTSLPEMQPQNGVGERISLDLVQGILSNRQYERAFNGTPLKRLGLKRFKRNLDVLSKNDNKDLTTDVVKGSVA